MDAFDIIACSVPLTVLGLSACAAKKQVLGRAEVLPNHGSVERCLSLVVLGIKLCTKAKEETSY